MACAILELVRKVAENVQRESTAQSLEAKKPESRKESRRNSMGITAEMRACYVPIVFLPISRAIS
jgi:hypothetical protein